MSKIGIFAIILKYLSLKIPKFYKYTTFKYHRNLGYIPNAWLSWQFPKCLGIGEISQIPTLIKNVNKLPESGLVYF